MWINTPVTVYFSGGVVVVVAATCQYGWCMSLQKQDKDKCVCVREKEKEKRKTEPMDSRWRWAYALGELFSLFLRLLSLLLLLLQKGQPYRSNLMLVVCVCLWLCMQEKEGRKKLREKGSKERMTCVKWKVTKMQQVTHEEKSINGPVGCLRRLTWLLPEFEKVDVRMGRE